MKKFVSLLLVMLLVLSLAACGGEKTEKLRVAMECAYAPYNWAQGTDENGAVKIAGSSDYAYGYDVMMAKLVAKELNKELEIVKLDWDALVPAVQSGDVDMVIAGQSITADRLKVVDFSDPYYYASIVTLVKKDSKFAGAKGLSDLAGAKCTSQIGTVWYDVCLGQIKDANILPAQETAPAMLVALESEAIELVVTDMPTAMAACEVYDFEILDFTGSDDNFEVSEEEINLGISIQKGNTELLDTVNKVLSRLSPEDYEKMMAEAIAVQPLSE